MPTEIPPTPDDTTQIPPIRVPTLSQSRQRGLGSTRPNPSPKPPSRAYELRNSGVEPTNNAAEVRHERRKENRCRRSGRLMRCRIGDGGAGCLGWWSSVVALQGE